MSGLPRRLASALKGLAATYKRGGPRGRAYTNLQKRLQVATEEASGELTPGRTQALEELSAALARHMTASEDDRPAALEVLISAANDVRRAWEKSLEEEEVEAAAREAEAEVCADEESLAVQMTAVEAANLVSGVTSPMFGIVFEPSFERPDSLEYEKTAVIPVDGDRSVSIAISGSLESARQLACGVFSCDLPEVDDEMIEGALCELLNMTAGLLKRRFGIDHGIGLPVVLEEPREVINWRGIILQAPEVRVVLSIADGAYPDVQLLTDDQLVELSNLDDEMAREPMYAGDGGLAAEVPEPQVEVGAEVEVAPVAEPPEDPASDPGEVAEEVARLASEPPDVSASAPSEPPALAQQSEQQSEVSGAGEAPVSSEANTTETLGEGSMSDDSSAAEPGSSSAAAVVPKKLEAALKALANVLTKGGPKGPAHANLIKRLQGVAGNSDEPLSDVHKGAVDSLVQALETHRDAAEAERGLATALLWRALEPLTGQPPPESALAAPAQAAPRLETPPPPSATIPSILPDLPGAIPLHSTDLGTASPFTGQRLAPPPVETPEEASAPTESLFSNVQVDQIEGAGAPVHPEQLQALPPPPPPPANQPPKSLTIIPESEEDQTLFCEFLVEARDHLETSELALLQLESNPEDKGAIDQVFRAFHTAKGVSAMLGQPTIAGFAHAAESLLSKMREGKLTCEGEIAQLALQSVDMLRVLLDRAESKAKGESIPAPPRCEELRLALLNPGGGGTEEGQDPAEAATVSVPVVANVGLEAVQVPKAPATPNSVAPAAPPGAAPPPAAAAPASPVAGGGGGPGGRAKKPGAARPIATDASVRVRTDTLDRLIDTVGELVIAQALVAHDPEVERAGQVELQKKVAHAGKLVRELQDLSTGLRVMPLRATFQKMARVVRDTARVSGKTVDFNVNGDETELDRQMVDALADPLVHMVRNAVDHGIENPERRRENGKSNRGKITLSAFRSGSMVVIELKDDGGGLDPKRIHAKAVERGLLNEDASLSDGEIFNLIFEPGFSTVEKVTQVSGRGVGMDVVKQEIDSLNGRIDIKSEIGVGTTFAVHLPLTLAITEGMLVRVGEQRYILPTSSIVACFRPDGEQLSTAANHGEIVRVRGECAPVFRLHHIFNLMDGERDPTHGLLLLIGAVGTTYALLVDEVLGQYQVVTKSLGKGVGKVEGVSGGAILGDGQVGLILDPAGISVKAKRLGPAPDMAA